MNEGIDVLVANVRIRDQIPAYREGGTRIEAGRRAKLQIVSDGVIRHVPVEIRLCIPGIVEQAGLANELLLRAKGLPAHFARRAS